MIDLQKMETARSLGISLKIVTWKTVRRIRILLRKILRIVIIPLRNQKRINLLKVNEVSGNQIKKIMIWG